MKNNDRKKNNDMQRSTKQTLCNKQNIEMNSGMISSSCSTNGTHRVTYQSE